MVIGVHCFPNRNDYPRGRRFYTKCLFGADYTREDDFFWKPSAKAAYMAYVKYVLERRVDGIKYKVR